MSSIETRLGALRRKLKAREGKKEYKENCEALKEEIARLEVAQQAASPSQDENNDGD